jgi:rhodanese-related sulfurtransferase
MDPKQLHNHRDRMQLVDVREPEEWQAGRIPGARWIPLNEIADRLDELDPDRPVVTTCRAGGRGGQAAELLTERGFRAENLEGGVQGWTDAGLPLRTPGDEQPGKVA